MEAGGCHSFPDAGLQVCSTTRGLYHHPWTTANRVRTDSQQFTSAEVRIYVLLWHVNGKS